MKQERTFFNDSFITGVSNSTPFEPLSCSFQVNPCSNTPVSFDSIISSACSQVLERPSNEPFDESMLEQEFTKKLQDSSAQELEYIENICFYLTIIGITLYVKKITLLVLHNHNLSLPSSGFKISSVLNY